MKLRDNILKSNLAKYAISLFFTLVFILARTFMGVYIFGFRVGEIMMGASLLILISSLIFFNKELTNSFGRNFIRINFFVLLSFIFNALYTSSPFTSPYTYKSSSYIWTIGFFFLGYFFFKVNNISTSYIYFQIGVLVYIYFFSIYGLPSSISDFFLSISDKFEPHKGSDILIIFVTVFFISNRLNSNKRFAFELFISFSVAYLPLVLFKSRASFIALLIFLVFEIIYFISELESNFKRTTILTIFCIGIFLQSVFLVSGSGFLEDSQESFVSEVEYGLDYIATYRADPDDEVFRLFYIAEDDLGSRTTRIFSTDNNLNWRLQIWQDVIYDLFNKDSLITGYGFQSMIPAMERIDRQGLDRLNENVHNFPVNLLARGGLVTLILYIYLYILIFSNMNKKYGSYYFLPFFVPVFFNTLFDVTMENSHYPLIFYFVIGMMFNKDKFFMTKKKIT
jgi:hypothetical protein